MRNSEQDKKMLKNLIKPILAIVIALGLYVLICHAGFFAVLTYSVMLVPILFISLVYIIWILSKNKKYIGVFVVIALTVAFFIWNPMAITEIISYSVYIFKFVILTVLVYGIGVIIFVCCEVKYYKGIIILSLFILLIGLLISQSNFVRARKCVDTDWMLGKTETLVKLRYYSPKDEWYADKVEVYDGVEYHFCISEIFYWGGLWEETGVKIYLVTTDEDGRITDVKWYAWGANGPAHDYDYWDRW